MPRQLLRQHSRELVLVGDDHGFVRFDRVDRDRRLVALAEAIQLVDRPDRIEILLERDPS
ncbi:hypothetical protein C3743_39435 [Burkholderia contaminans]|uniref:Uncharacterized protein n=1 Tax=Burkholderia contaminans TaxID=488447 RepID=A0A2S5DMG7_9BURK|nr:hypothetical protein C3743_39435 [Burkholderia contaminans]